MKKKEASPASPPVVPVEVTHTLRFSQLHDYNISYWPKGHFIKILACNLLRYCIYSSYCCYTCDLNILGTCIEASVLSSQNRGVTSGIRAISIAWRKPTSKWSIFKVKLISYCFPPLPWLLFPFVIASQIKKKISIIWPQPLVVNGFPPGPPVSSLPWI
jgi:hypothetical protein